MHREYADSNVLYLHQFATDASSPACLVSICVLALGMLQTGSLGQGSVSDTDKPDFV